jgi:hypothetical protein
LGTKGPPAKVTHCNADWLLVQIVSSTVVAPLPAIIAGEKVAVAPYGSPVAVNVVGSGNFPADPGVNARLKVATPPANGGTTTQHIGVEEHR